MIRDQQVTLVTRQQTGVDGHGNAVHTPTEIGAAGWSVQPDTSTETLGGRDRVVTDLVAYAPPGVDLTAVDAVRVGADTYEVRGDVEHWPSPTGHLDHVRLRLRKVTG